MKIKIVLIEPQTPGNIGAICRVMANFGLSELLVVDPKCDLMDIEAVKRAKHAKYILENIKQITLEQVLENDLIVGTSAIIAGDRNIERTPLPVSEFADKLKDKAETNYDVAIVFGREGEGLHMDELEKMDYNIFIPSNRDYQTLNLSQAVAIIAYELFHRYGKEDFHYYAKNRKYMDSETKQALLEKYNQLSEKIEFDTEEHKITRDKVFAKVINKANLTKREAFALFGLLKKMENQLK